MQGTTTINFHRAVKVVHRVDQYPAFFANRFTFYDASGNTLEVTAFSDAAALDIPITTVRVIADKEEA